MSIFKRGRVYWYHFIFNGDHVQESTKQGNPRISRHMEAAHRTSLAKGEVGIREKKQVPKLVEFCRNRVEPWAKAQFEKTCMANLRWYRSRMRSLCSYERLANLRLDEITSENAADFARNEMTRVHASHVTRGERRKKAKATGPLSISTVNTSLRALRRILRLAVEWGLISAAPKIRLLPGEQCRERVVTAEDEAKYLAGAPEPLSSIATVLVDTGLRPDECYRLQWDDVSFEDFKYGSLSVRHWKTKAARRKIALTPRVRNLLEALWTNADQPQTGWVFPADTKSGHADHATIRKQHVQALRTCAVRPFVLYSLRHTFLTRLGASGCDVWVLARIAGHSSIQMSAKYVHPDENAVLNAMARIPEAKELTQ